MLHGVCMCINAREMLAGCARQELRDQGPHTRLHESGLFGGKTNG